MSSEVDVIRDDGSLEVFPPGRPPMQSAMAILRAHAEMMDTAYHLAKAMCATTMVPDRFKGKPHDGAAAILYGAELGLIPIQSLQRIIGIHGMPALEARTMVALVQARGYKVKVPWRLGGWVRKGVDDELMQSDTSVTVWGRDLDGDEYESTWTIERATKAGYVPQMENGKFRVNKNGNLIGNEKYLTDPQAMLKAKAQAEVCRDMAPEILLGISYTTEDLESEAPFTAPSPQPSTNGQDTITAEEIIADVSDAEVVEEQRSGPLTDEEILEGGHVVGKPYTTTIRGTEPIANRIPPSVTVNPVVPKRPAAEDMTPDVPDEQDERAVYEHNQVETRKLFALLRKAGIDNTTANKERRMAIFRFITGRDDIDSTNHVTPDELSDMAAILYSWDKQKVLGKKVDEILLTLVDDNTDSGEQEGSTADE